MVKSLLILVSIFLIVACDGADESFEPNNLISVSEDEKAERQRALLSGGPVFQEFTITSPRVFDVGEKIGINVKFQKRTKIDNGGIPRIPLNIGGVTRYANYVSGSDSTNFTFRFEYTVQAGDLDHNGIQLQSPWELNGSVITDYADQAAILTYTPPNTSDRLVDTSNLTAAFTSGYTNGATGTINLSADNASTVYVGTGCISGGSATAYAATKTASIYNNNGTNTFFVAAGNGSGGYSQCVQVDIVHDNQAPGAVSAVTLANDASDIESDNTTWNAASDSGPAGIAYYEIAVSTTNAVGGIILPEGNWKNVGNNLTGSIDNGATPWLAAATNYYTLIRAVDNAGNTSSSVVSSAAWQLVALSPEQITSMSVVEAANDSIRVGWPYPDDNGFAITDYVIQYKLNSDSTWITINDGVSTSRRYTLSGLTAETSYDFRVRAFNGTNFGAWSPTLTAETLPNIDFVTFDYIAINIGGATGNALVSMEDDNEIYYGNNSASAYNDGSLISADLDKGENISVDADDFTVVTATKPFFIAGSLRSGNNDTQKANVVWATKSWIGKSFLFNHNRTNPMKVKVYAFTDSDVVVSQNGVPIAGGTINDLTAESGHIFTINSFGSYEITSTGFIVAYGYANGGGGLNYVDPKPFLPASNDLVGVPSRDAKISTANDGTSIQAYHSGGFNETEDIVTAGAVGNIDQRGTSGLYRDDSVRLRSNFPIVANSYADANGTCSAPLVPVAFQKTKFAINVEAQWVAMASTNELTVTAYEPDSAGGFNTFTYNMTRFDAENNRPTKQYEGTKRFKAGTIFEGTAPFQMWYEPRNDSNATSDVPGGEINAARRDETILFGWD